MRHGAELLDRMIFTTIDVVEMYRRRVKKVATQESHPGWGAAAMVAKVDDQRTRPRQEGHGCRDRFGGFLGFVKRVDAQVADIPGQPFSLVETVVVQPGFSPIRGERRWIGI